MEFKKTVGRGAYNADDNLAKISLKRYGTDSVCAVATHEIAHWIEHGMPELKKELRELYGKITEGKPLPLPKKGEFYRKATIPMPENYYTRDYGPTVEHIIATKAVQKTVLRRIVQVCIDRAKQAGWET